MSFFDALHKIQKKPEATRKKILAVSVAVIMALIIFLWLSGLKYSKQEASVSQEPGPFSVFKETIQKGIKSLKEL